MLRTEFESMKSLMEPTPRAFGAGSIRETGGGHRSRPGILFVALAEFTRAMAATRRCRDLRYREGIAPAAIPQRIFEEFYSDSEDAAAVVRFRSARRFS
jgi:hypothetical protein